MKKSVKKYLLVASALLATSSLAVVTAACVSTEKEKLNDRETKLLDQENSSTEPEIKSREKRENDKLSDFDFNLTKTKPVLVSKQKIYLSDHNKSIIEQEIKAFKEKLAKEVNFDTKPVALNWNTNNLPDQFKNNPAFIIDGKFLKDIKHNEARLFSLLPLIHDGIMPLISTVESTKQNDLVNLLINEKQLKEKSPLHISLNPFALNNYLNSPLFLYDVQHGIVRNLYWFINSQNNAQWKQATLEGFIPNKSIRIPSRSLLIEPDFNPSNQKVVNLVLELKNEKNQRINLDLQVKPISVTAHDNTNHWVYENPIVDFSNLEGNEFSFVSLKEKGKDKDLFNDQFKQRPIFVRYSKDAKVPPVYGLSLNTIIENRYHTSFLSQYLNVDPQIFTSLQRNIGDNRSPFFFNKNLKDVTRQEIDNLLIPYFLTNNYSSNLTLRYEVSDVNYQTQELAINAVFKNKVTNEEYKTNKIIFGFDKFENLEVEKIIKNTETSLYVPAKYDTKTANGKKNIEEYLKKNKLTFDNITYENLSEIWSVVHSDFDFEKFEHPKIEMVKNPDKTITLKVSMKQWYVNDQIKTNNDFVVVKEFNIDYFKNN